MTAIGQALHVARKDLRESSWPITVYVFLVALALAGAEGFWSSPMVPGIAVYFIVFSGMAVVAMLVQSDSPTRTDAFWATRPLRPTSVVMAKIVVATVVVLGLAVLAQALALSSFDLGGAAIVRRLRAATFTYACWLLVAMALAAVTRDIRAFVTALLCTLVLTYFVWVVWVIRSWDAAIGGAESWTIFAVRLVAWLGAAGAVALLLWLYRQRARGPVGLLVAAAAAGGGLVGAFGTPVVSAAPDEPTAGARTAIMISMSRTRSGTVGDILLDVRPTGTHPGRAHTLRAVHADFELADGTTLGLNEISSIVELDAARPAIPNSAWLTSSPDSTLGGILFFHADGAQRRVLERGIKRVVVTGRLWESAPQLAAGMPVVVNSPFASSGRRATVTSWSHSRGRGEMQLDVTALPWPVVNEGPRIVTSGGALRYALVNDARHEALPLFIRGTGTTTSWLVLPGDAAWTSRLTLDTRASDNTSEGPVDDGWFDGARLMFIDWVPTASYPVRAEVTLSAVSPP